MVGSEGTLAFVAEAVFDTVRSGRTPTCAGCCSRTSTPPPRGAGLVDAGASATELMFASTLLAAAYNMPGHARALEVAEARGRRAAGRVPADADEQLDEPERRGVEILQGARLLEPARFSREREEIEM